MTGALSVGTVTIGERQWQVELAVTPEELAAGLGGLESIPAATGMLFDLGASSPVQVTTEPMLFNIDVIFISEALQVEDVVLDIPPGYVITQETPVRYFLEVNAGEAPGVEARDTVDMALDYSAEEPPPTGGVAEITGFMQFAVTAAIVGLFAGGMLKVFTSAALGKPKQPGKPSPRLEYPEFEHLSSTKESAAGRHKPARDDVNVKAWQERDRLGIWITDTRSGKTVAEWWDEDAREMFEQGFFKPGLPQHSWESPGRGFTESVLGYAESVGILGGVSKSSAVIPAEPRGPRSGSIQKGLT
jgi:uncharacterized membrane protein (UPF0127 family)